MNRFKISVRGEFSGESICKVVILSIEMCRIMFDKSFIFNLGD